MQLIYGVLIFCILWCLIYYTKRDLFYYMLPNMSVRSNLDDDYYSVCRGFKDPTKAANVLAHLNNMNVEVMRHVRSTKELQTPWLQNKINILMAQYDPQAMIENSPHNFDIPRTTSYTVNKGDYMAICTRSLETDNIEDIHTLEFVVLHELAHVITDTWGHETPFWVNFKWILKEANDAGIHKPKNYSKYPVRYCGMEVNYNPFFDDAVADLK